MVIEPPEGGFEYGPGGTVDQVQSGELDTVEDDDGNVEVVESDSGSDDSGGDSTTDTTESTQSAESVGNVVKETSKNMEPADPGDSGTEFSGEETSEVVGPAPASDESDSGSDSSGDDRRRNSRGQVIAPKSRGGPAAPPTPEDAGDTIDPDAAPGTQQQQFVNQENQDLETSDYADTAPGLTDEEIIQADEFGDTVRGRVNNQPGDPEDVNPEAFRPEDDTTKETAQRAREAANEAEKEAAKQSEFLEKEDFEGQITKTEDGIRVDVEKAPGAEQERRSELKQSLRKQAAENSQQFGKDDFEISLSESDDGRLDASASLTEQAQKQRREGLKLSAVRDAASQYDRYGVNDFEASVEETENGLVAKATVADDATASFGDVETFGRGDRGQQSSRDFNLLDVDGGSTRPITGDTRRRQTQAVSTTQPQGQISTDPEVVQALTTGGVLSESQEENLDTVATRYSDASRFVANDVVGGVIPGETAPERFLEGGVETIGELGNVPSFVGTAETATEVATNLPEQAAENPAATGETAVASGRDVAAAGAEALREQPFRTAGNLAAGGAVGVASGTAISAAASRSAAVATAANKVPDLDLTGVYNPDGDTAASRRAAEVDRMADDQVERLAAESGDQLGTGGTGSLLDTDTVDSARGISGPSRTSRVRSRLSRTIESTRESFEDRLANSQFLSSDRGQQTLVGRSGRQDTADDATQPSVDYDPSRDDILAGSPRDRLSDDITDRQMTQRRQASGDFEAESDPLGRAGRRRERAQRSEVRAGDDTPTPSLSVSPSVGALLGADSALDSALLSSAQESQIGVTAFGPSTTGRVSNQVDNTPADRLDDFVGTAIGQRTGVRSRADAAVLTGTFVRTDERTDQRSRADQREREQARERNRTPDLTPNRNGRSDNNVNPDRDPDLTDSRRYTRDPEDDDGQNTLLYERGPELGSPGEIDGEPNPDWASETIATLAGLEPREATESTADALGRTALESQVGSGRRAEQFDATVETLAGFGADGEGDSGFGGAEAGGFEFAFGESQSDAADDGDLLDLGGDDGGGLL